MRTINYFSAAAIGLSAAACSGEKPAHDQIAATGDPTKTVVISSLTTNPSDWGRLSNRYDAVRQAGTCKTSPMQEPDYDCLKREVKSGLSARYN